MSEAVLIGKIILWGFVLFMVVVLGYLCWFFLKQLKRYFGNLSENKQAIPKNNNVLLTKEHHDALVSDVKKRINKAKEVIYKCPHCGKKVHIKNKFCRHCGEKLK